MTPTPVLPSLPEPDASRQAIDFLKAEIDVYGRECYELGKAHAIESLSRAPIDMVLHCPNCGEQHIDASEDADPLRSWDNPPHRSHQCHFCTTADGKPFVWRPADVPTNGVAAVKTTGKADSPIAAAQWDAAKIKQPGWDHVMRAFADGAREARVNADATDADFWRAADGYTKRVFEVVDPVSEAALRTESWAQAETSIASRAPAEPVAWRVDGGFWTKFESIPVALRSGAVPLYAHPTESAGPGNAEIVRTLLVDLRVRIHNEDFIGTCGSREEAKKLEAEHYALLKRIDAALGESHEG